MKNKKRLSTISLICFLSALGSGLLAQKVKPEIILSKYEILHLVKEGIPELSEYYAAVKNQKNDDALELLAAYLKDKLGERYFFNWKNFNTKFSEYAARYPDEVIKNVKRSNEQIIKYPANVRWKIPFEDLRGESVTAYELRHLARQQRAADMMFRFYLEGEEEKYLNYFVTQVKSLNSAFINNEYETGGNAVFEVFRAGYRIHNWLFAFNGYLASEKFSKHNQIELIITFLYHGSVLYDGTKKFRYGNHHTKGLMALAQIAILFPEFKFSDEWLNTAIGGLTEHLQKEINDDGFQFERSVHYHKGDIDNYFYIYQLAKKNKLELPEVFEEKFYLMFESLAQIAMPDNTLPVLQDDTDEPWGEFNKLTSVMNLGSILFENGEFDYFASKEICGDKFWFVDDDIRNENKSKKTPKNKSIALETTGYYAMRNGWEESSKYMIVTCGLSEKKPDHQHADMLGIVAYSNGNVILPNYQVRYFLPDFPFFKSSWVKNVAIADSIPQTVEWKPNEGNSGFGKWLDLPQPKRKAWITNDSFDYFSGTHNGYDKKGINYTREILFVKDGFWIVRDKFVSDAEHSYQQIWQGHYNTLSRNHLRSTFSNGSGLEIIQLREAEYEINQNSFRGKGSSLFNVNGKREFTFTTLLYPFSHFDSRLLEDAETNKLFDWQIIKNGSIKSQQLDFTSNASLLIYNNSSKLILLDADRIELSGKEIRFEKRVNVFLEINESGILLMSLDETEVNLQSVDKSNSQKKIIMLPGETVPID
ncbi:MAG: heparinase II/III family protein [Bacteroidetes bacterium]|nr:heparinase II/III family protein [Bacteroidota bacterium]